MLPTFANPLLLFGLAGISIPIIIHLLNRRKFQTVVWAAMRFVRISVEQNQRRIKIEDMLLLILRCILITLIALALAQPILRAAAAFLGETRSTAVIILDNSYSMSQTDGVQSRFDAAKKAANEIIHSMPPGSSVAVLLASDKVAPLIPEPTYDLALARRQINNAPLFDRASDLLPALKSALDTLAGRPATRKEIFLITDGQTLAFRQLPQIKTLLEDNQHDLRTNILVVGAPEQRNLAITAIRLDGGLCPLNVPLRLEVRVKNHGKLEVKDLNVSIAVDSDPPMDQAAIPSIPPNESRSVSLFAKLRSPGYHTVTARIDPDHLPADDTRTLALRAVKDIKILVIDGDTGREPRESESFFLKAALQPVPRTERDDYFIQPTVKTPTELDAVRFEDFDAVISANVTDFSQQTAAQLANYVRSGGSLLVFPGDNINLSFYNDILHDRLHILPARLAPPVGDAASQDKFFTLQNSNLTHPITSLWQDPASGSLSTARFYKAFPLQIPPHSAPQSTTANRQSPTLILRFADGQTAAAEHDLALGRVVLFASSADTAWNDLPVRAGIFVPLLHRTLGHLIARQDEHLTIPVGQPFVHPAPVEFINKDALITKSPRRYAQHASQTEELRESRRIEMENGIPTLRFAQTDFAGPYDIKIDSTLIRFAAQPHPDESALESLSPDQLKSLAHLTRIIPWTPGSPLRDSLEQARVGTPLAFPLAFLALILATAETLLAHWFSKSK